MSESSYADLNRESRSLMAELAREQPELLKSFQGLHHAAMATKALDTKTKELIALGTAITAQCSRCIGLHVAAALKAGASADEIGEAIGVATLMGGGPAMMYGLDAFKALKELSAAS
jgi:AhpD family alkylhydroperoxidase